MSVSVLDNMSPEDRAMVGDVEEQLRKAKIGLSGDSEVTVAKDSKFGEVKEFEKKIEDIKEDDFNISKIKDEASGYDQGARDKLENEIAKGKLLKLDVSELEQKLKKMIAVMEREKALNADSNEVEKISPIDNSVSSDPDNPHDDLVKLKKEAFELFDSLLSRGVINLFKMSSGFIKSDDGVNNVEVNRDNVYIVNTANSEELGEVERLVKINKEIHERSPQDDLMEHFVEKFEDGKVAQVYSYLALKDTDDETDLRKLSSEERSEMRKLFEKNPDDFKICTHAVGDEEILPDLIKESEAVLSNKFFEFMSSREIFGSPKNANDVPSPSIALATAITLVENIAQIGITVAQNASNVPFSSMTSNAINLVEGIAMQINENSNDQSFVERMKKQNESGNKNNARQL